MNAVPERILPTLRLAVLCQDVEDDGGGRPFRLVNPVHTLRFGPGVSQNYRPPMLTLYTQFQGRQGTFYIRAQLRVVGSAAEIAGAGPVEYVFDGADRIEPEEIALELDSLVFPKPDVYELLVYVNHVNLNEPGEGRPHLFLTTRVAVLPADGTPGGVE